MSSDESVIQYGITQYYIKRPVWRHAMLEPFLRAFDAIHRLNRLRSDRRGAPVHNRISSRRASATAAPSYLPRNAYDEDWLRDAPLRVRDMLRESEPVAFVHTAEILR